MSTPAGIVNPAPVDGNVQIADTDAYSADSSDDSRSSSGSTGSESATSKSGSVTSSKVDSQNQEIDPKLSASSNGSQSGSVGSESGSDDESISDDEKASDPNASFKSAVTSGATVNLATTESPVFATPLAASEVNPKVSSPQVLGTSSKAASGNNSGSSPLIVTPAKSLSFDSGSTPKAVPVTKSDVSVSMANSASNVVCEAVAGIRPGSHPSTPTKHLPRGVEVPQAASTDSSSGQHSQAGTSVPVPVKDKKTRSSVKASRKDKTRKQQQPLTVKKDPSPPKTRSVHKKHRKQVDEQVIEPVVAQMAIVATEPELQPEHRKRHRKPRDVEPPKKAKVAESFKKTEAAEIRSESTGESESVESSPDRPGPSSRIGKISQGRRFQRLAMSRAKRLGTIVDGSIQHGAISASELSKALKKVPKAQFNIQPTHAYQDFHKIAGTMFPHVRKIFRDIRSRYGVILGATSELQLSLAVEQESAKASLIKPDADSRFPVLWRFDNDLNRATANPVDREAELNDSSQTLEEGTEVDYKDLPNLLATPARVEAVKDQSAACSSRGPSSKVHKVASTDNQDKKSRKKRKKHSSQVRL